MATVKLLEVEGDARQRGEAHGEAMRDEIVAGVGRWREQMNAIQPMNPDDFIEHVNSSTRFLEAVERQTPDLLEEVRGIAVGADLDFDTVFAFQLLDECWWLAAELVQTTGTNAGTNESCSSLAVGDVGGAPLVAQTMDLPLHYDGGQVLLRFTDPLSGVRQLVFTVAGLVGLNGVNNHRLGVCVNTLPELSCSREGLPVAFVVRSVLATTNLAGAKTLVEATLHASGQNYVLASPDGIVDLEAGAGSVIRYPGIGGGDLVYHTNHQVVAGLDGRTHLPAAGTRPGFYVWRLYHDVGHGTGSACCPRSANEVELRAT